MNVEKNYEKRRKKEKRRKVCLTHFDQNSLTSLDLARLRQIMSKLTSRLLTEGLTRTMKPKLAAEMVKEIVQTCLSESGPKKT